MECFLSGGCNASCGHSLLGLHNGYQGVSYYSQTLETLLEPTSSSSVEL